MLCKLNSPETKRKNFIINANFISLKLNDPKFFNFFISYPSISNGYKAIKL